MKANLLVQIVIVLINLSETKIRFFCQKSKFILFGNFYSPEKYTFIRNRIINRHRRNYHTANDKLQRGKKLHIAGFFCEPDNHDVRMCFQTIADSRDKLNSC